MRKGKLGLRKSTKADFSGQQLVHFVFERALRKFRCVICCFFVCVRACCFDVYLYNVCVSVLALPSPMSMHLTPFHPHHHHTRACYVCDSGDLELWLQYLDYCEQTGAAKALSRALAQALQIFPRQVCPLQQCRGGGAAVIITIVTSRSLTQLLHSLTIDDTPPPHPHTNTRQAGLWVRAASHEYFENASPPAARVLMQRGLRLNGCVRPAPLLPVTRASTTAALSHTIHPSIHQPINPSNIPSTAPLNPSIHQPTRAESALLWSQYFKLELLYVQKLRGRRLALGLPGASGAPDAAAAAEAQQEEEGEEGGEGACPVEVPTLAEEDDGDDHYLAAAPPAAVPELDPSDPRAQSVQAVLEGAVPRVVYAAAVAARPQDLQLRLDCLATLAGLPGASSGEEEDGGHFEPLAQEMLAGIDRDVGPEAGAWARALHALRTAPAAAAAAGVAMATAGEKAKGKGGKKRPRAEEEEGRASGGRGPAPCPPRRRPAWRRWSAG